MRTRDREAYLELFDAVFVPQVIEITQELDAFLADVNILVETFDEDPEDLGAGVHNIDHQSLVPHGATKLPLEDRTSEGQHELVSPDHHCVLVQTKPRNVIVNNFELDIIPDGPRPSQLLYLLCRAVADVIIICLIDL